MLKLNVKGNKGTYDLNLPTNFNEITEEYIEQVTKHIVPDANYTVVGLLYREKLSTLILATKKKNNKSEIAVTPIFVKAGKTDSEFINSLSIKDKLIISPSDIMLGHHLSSSINLLTINNILDIIDGDNNVYSNVAFSNEYCYFIEFKLIPNCNIHGCYKKLDNIAVGTFVTKISDSTNNDIYIPKNNIIV